MEIELENFGIIKHFNFNAKDDFSIIFGKNNTGKSYAISVVYLIIKNILNLEESFYVHSLISEIKNSEITMSFQDKLKNKKTLNIKKDLEQLIINILSKTLIESIQESFKSTFDSIESLQNQLTEKKIKIKIITDLISFTIKVKNKNLYIDHLTINREKIELINSKRNLSNKDSGKIISIYTSSDRDKFSNKILMFIIETSMYLTFDLKEVIKNVHYLPASRSGLYQALSAFGQIIAELSKSRKFTTKKIELPSISEPLSDYFLELSNIKVQKKEVSNKITEVASEIEKKILNGKIEFDKNTKKLMFSPKNTSLKLDLSYTSSMVSEISPIVSYLRYVINYADEPNIFLPFMNENKFEKSKHLIIIEEPEAHLHPDVQVELLKQFAELAKKHVKFIITTHSNYMFNKFNNLIIAGEINTTNSSALLFKENVDGSDVIKMEMDKFGIEDENFIYTSEDLYNEKSDLIQKLNQKSH